MFFNKIIHNSDFKIEKKTKIAKHRFQTLVYRNPKTLCVKILKLQVNMSPYFAKTMSRI